MDETLKFAGKYRIPSARLVEYDYGSNGLYFITICTKDRATFLGQIDPDTALFQPSSIGQVAMDCWAAIPTFSPFVELDAFQLMPNHLHGVLRINKPGGSQIICQPNRFGSQSQNLASIIRGYKSAVTKHATMNQLAFGWQPSFYERVVRNQDELIRIQRYIENNPAQWANDKHNPVGIFM